MHSEPVTVPQLLLNRIAATPSYDAFSFPRGPSWKTISWREFGEQVRKVSMGLRTLGLGQEQRVAIMAGTCYEWILADMGILCAGGATTTVYPNNTPEDYAYIIQDSNAVFVFAENSEQVAKLAAKRSETPNIKNVIVFNGAKSPDGWVIPLEELMQLGEKATQADWEKVCLTVQKDHLATLIYTSGTTGRPKGVELIHDCWVYEAEATHQLGLLLPDDTQYLWLPLSHVFGKVLEAAQLRIGFKTAVDGRVDKLVENLAVVKPTFVAAVPRIFEKVYNRVVMAAKEGGAAKYRIFKWAMSVGYRVSKLRQKGQSPTGLLSLQNALADRLVFSKLRARFGGKLRYFISGSAPLNRDLAEFFHAAGILILEGYGLTESSAATFVNRPDSFEFGTVGPPMPGTEFKIAEDGEILVKGRGLMRGYHGKKAETDEVLKNGWLHTGDIGEKTDRGLLRITDRKKDLIKTSGGKYVAPQAIEGQFKTICPYASQVLVHGNNRNFCAMLIALDPETITKWAKAQNISGDYAQIVETKEARALIKPFIDQLNEKLAKHETIKKFAILPRDLTIESDDLTPSQKLKRKAVEAKYKDLLDGFYSGSLAEAA